MPELPEVETIARQLRQYFLGKRLSSIEARQVRIFQNINAEEFCANLRGRKLISIDRYGKFLYWNMEGFYPVFHLGMSGIFLKEKSQSNYPQHIHISMTFNQNLNLYFQDVRKFSKIFLYHKKPNFSQLGIDPTCKNFTLNNLKKLLNLRSVNIKNILMDQGIIAGIGNIYANEILYDARIYPLRPANSLNSNEIRQIYHSIKKIMNLAVERFGTTYSAYRTVQGNTGDNQNFLKVYQKEGTTCPVCGTVIEKMFVSSRSTFYCKKCQIRVK